MLPVVNGKEDLGAASGIPISVKYDDKQYRWQYDDVQYNHAILRTYSVMGILQQTTILFL